MIHCLSQEPYYNLYSCYFEISPAKLLLAANKRDTIPPFTRLFSEPLGTWEHERYLPNLWAPGGAGPAAPRPKLCAPGAPMESIPGACGRTIPGRGTGCPMPLPAADMLANPATAACCWSCCCCAVYAAFCIRAVPYILVWPYALAVAVAASCCAPAAPAPVVAEYPVL